MINYARQQVQNSSRQVQERIDNTKNKFLSTVTEIKLWIPRKLTEMTHRLLQWIYLGLQLAITLVIIVIISHLLYFVIRKRVVPRALINEAVHFDYLSSPPIARIGLNSVEKQWSYITQPSPLDSVINDTGSPIRNIQKTLREKRFLKAGNRYNVDMTFKLAKSANNYALGKFVTTLTMIDSLNLSLAASIRPVIMPYQAPHVAYIDALVQYVTFPLYGRRDDVTLSLQIMNDYEEPALHLAGTDSLQVTVSSATFDLLETHITLMPKLSGLAYFMFHHPSLSFLVGVCFLTGVQVTVYGLIFVIALVLRHVLSSPTNSTSSSSSSSGGESSSNESGDDDDRAIAGSRRGIRPVRQARLVGRSEGEVNVIEEQEEPSSVLRRRAVSLAMSLREDLNQAKRE